MARRRFRGGGLAQIAGVDTEEVDPSLEEDPNAAPGALEEVANPYAQQIVTGAMPESLRKARELNKMTRDDAIRRLEEGRAALQLKKYDPSAKWLAMAQGFLAPTKTGGFGESLGNAAGLVGDVVKDTQAYETGHEKQLLDIETELAKAEENYADREIDILQAEEYGNVGRSGARGVGFDAYIPDPDKPGKEILVRMMSDDRAPGGVRAQTYDGRLLRVPDNLDPRTRGLIAEAVTLGRLNPTDINEQINKIRLGKERLAATYFGLDLVKKVRKGGGTGLIQSYVQRIREAFGSEAADVADRGQLMALMGDQLFAALESFGSQINERELLTARDQLAAGATRSTAINERLLEQLAMKLEAEISSVKGLTETYGDGQQQFAANRPLIDYGLTPETRQRAEKIGFQFTEFVPFAQEEVKVATPRKPGETGHMQTPWVPKTADELKALMREPESMGAQVGDWFQVYDSKTGKYLNKQVK